VNEASRYVDGSRAPEQPSVVKQVVYMLKRQQIKYVLDEDGEVIIPVKDTVIELDGKKYSVLTVPRSPACPAGAFPVWTVDLEEA
jgi:hypothetical protein